MATTGSIDVDLNNFRDMINASSELGDNVTRGVADQGEIIGLAIGLNIAIVLLFGVIFVLLGILVVLIKRTKGLKSA